jgi:hypothetical protein
LVIVLYDWPMLLLPVLVDGDGDGEGVVWCGS